MGISYSDLDILEDMSYVVGLRGSEGAGIIQGKVPYHSVDKAYEDLKFNKTRWDIGHFMRYNKHHPDGDKNLFNGVTNNFFAVHVRAATMGAVTDKNAHPFDVGRFIGMHNGTLDSIKYHMAGKTDSEAMFDDMNERGVDAVLRGLSQKDAYAVVIFDKETGCIHLGTNGRRPLHIAFHATRSVIYWASEDWMIREIMKRKNEKTVDNQVYYLSPGTVYTIDPARVPRKVTDLECYELFPKEEKKVSENRTSTDTTVGKMVSKYNQRQERNKKRRKAKSLKGFKDFTSLVSSMSKEDPPFDPPYSDSNVIPFTGKVKTPTIPKGHCCSCNREMKLSEQYFATKQQGLLICETCDDTYSSVMVN